MNEELFKVGKKYMSGMGVTYEFVAYAASAAEHSQAVFVNLTTGDISTRNVNGHILTHTRSLPDIIPQELKEPVQVSGWLMVKGDSTPKFFGVKVDAELAAGEEGTVVYISGVEGVEPWNS